MIRSIVGWVMLTALCVVAPAATGWAEDMEPRMALHLIATYQYPSCSDMAPASPEEVRTELTSKDLARSKGFGYVCLLIYGVEGIAGVEFALRGFSDAEGLKAGRIEWCPESALHLGDFMDRGGIVAFPCVRRVEGEQFIVVGYIPFEYHGDNNLQISIVPSSYSKPQSPMCYMLDCTTQFAEHRIVETSGAAIEGSGSSLRSRRALRGASLMWGMDGTGKVTVNRLDEEGAAMRGAQRAFPTSWVLVDRTLTRISSGGEVGITMSDPGARWVLPSGAGDRVLRFRREQAGASRTMAPLDVELLDGSGNVVFGEPSAGHRGWISPDGSRIAWQEVGHAGRLDTGYRLRDEKRGKLATPAIALQEAAFLVDGEMVGWGRDLRKGRGDGAAEEWGVFAIGLDGRLKWARTVPKAEMATLAVSEGGVAHGLVGRDGQLVLRGWSPGGTELYTRETTLGGGVGARGGRMVSAISPDGTRVAVGWAVRGDVRSYVLALFDGEKGELLWTSNAGEDLGDPAMAPDRVVFSGDGKMIGLLSFSMGDPPAGGIAVYDEDGTMIWRRKNSRCFGMSRDLRLSESGDEVLFVTCGSAYLYHIHASEQ